MTMHEHKLFEFTSPFGRTLTLNRFEYDDTRPTEYVWKCDAPDERAVSCTMVATDLPELHFVLGNEINIPDPPA